MSTPMIQTVNLTKRYGALTALDNLNLEIQAGDAFGFIGPNGAGKTTTIKILATLLKPTWGEARVGGLSVGPVHAREVRRIIGYVPDFFGSYEDMLVEEYLSFFAAAYQIEPARRRSIMDEVLQLTDLTHKADAPVSGLSRGMQQRLSVARVLLHDPKVLLMDEPSSGLDPRARVEMRELLKELHRMGKTILISSHILPELADLCNRVAIIERGKLQFVGTPQDLVAQVKTAHAFLVGVEERAEAAATLLAGVEGVEKVVPLDGGLMRVVLHAGESPARLAARLVGEGFRLTRLDEEAINLETAFMRLTKGLVQ